jgi:hypothetical protein
MRGTEGYKPDKHEQTGDFHDTCGNTLHGQLLRPIKLYFFDRLEQVAQ